MDHLTRLQTVLSERYRVIREIGAGGMATVYLAEDIKHRPKVALKVLRPELAAVLGPERFLSEIKRHGKSTAPASAASVRFGRGGRAAVLCDAVHRRGVAAASPGARAPTAGR